MQTAIRPFHIPDKQHSTCITTASTYTSTTLLFATINMMTMPASKHFSFLRLPAELRNKIYAIVLAFSAFEPSGTFTPQITRVCRQLHEETISYLYSEEFVAHHSLLTSLPSCRSPSRPVFASRYISLIRKWRIILRLDCDTRYTKEDVTKAFSGMNTVCIEAYEASYKASGLHSLEKFSGIRGVKKASVKGSVPDEMAAWLVQAMQSDIGTEILMWKGTEWDVWENGNR